MVTWLKRLSSAQKRLATLTVEASLILSLILGTPLVASAATFFFTLPITSAGVITSNFSTVTGLSPSTALNAGIFWKLYRGDYPDTSSNPCASGVGTTVADVDANIYPVGFVPLLTSQSAFCGADSTPQHYWASILLGNGDLYVTQYSFNGSTYTPVISDTTTRILTTTPASGSTVATSTSFTIGATGYIAPSDYQSGMFLEIKFLQQSSGQAAVGNVELLASTFDIPITGSGGFSVSTTTSITRAGNYVVNTTIRQPSFANTALNFLGFGQFATFGTLSATTTSFTADHQTAFDILVASTTEAFDAYVASSTVSLGSCTDWTHLNLIDCLNLLLFPQTQPIVAALTNFKNGFLSYFPWGYVTRLIVIFSGNSGTNLPAFSVPVPISATETIYVNYDEQDMLAGGAAVLDSACSTTQLGMPCRSVIEPYLIEFLAVLVVMIIARDLWGIAHQGSHQPQRKLS